jgi:hypothetical protein
MEVNVDRPNSKRCSTWIAGRYRTPVFSRRRGTSAGRWLSRRTHSQEALNSGHA